MSSAYYIVLIVLLASLSQASQPKCILESQSFTCPTNALGEGTYRLDFGFTVPPVTVLDIEFTYLNYALNENLSCSIVSVTLTLNETVVLDRAFEPEPNVHFLANMKAHSSTTFYEGSLLLCGISKFSNSSFGGTFQLYAQYTGLGNESDDNLIDDESRRKSEFLVLIFVMSMFTVIVYIVIQRKKDEGGFNFSHYHHSFARTVFSSKCPSPVSHCPKSWRSEFCRQEPFE